MIQRVQSIYLVLAGLFPAFTFFLPIAGFQSATADFKMFACHFAGKGAEAAGAAPYATAVLAVLAIVLAFVAIFGFKNRKKQLKKCTWVMLANVAWYVAAAAYIIPLISGDAFSLVVGPTLYAPLLSIVCTMLAKRAIRKDEALVRAADRIR